MTSPEQRDPVEVLKMRLGRAIEAHRKVQTGKTDVYATLNDLLLALALTPWLPAVQAVARELVGTGEAGTEWVAFWGIGDDPNAGRPLLPVGMAGFIRCDDRSEAVAIAHNHRGRVAQRQVTVYRTPWQAGGTEGGEPR